MARQTKAEKAAYKAKMDARYAEAKAIVASDVCPQCGCGFRRNLSMAGWFQCQQFGAEGFRKDATKPSCSFQTFTE